MQPSFDDYVRETRDWLKEHRDFVSTEVERELEMNALFYLAPEQPSDKGVLLVHGLGDSPFYFKDIASYKIYVQI